LCDGRSIVCAGASGISVKDSKLNSFIHHWIFSGVASASFRERIAADSEFLRLGYLEFDPGTAASTALVERIQSFRDQACQAVFSEIPLTGKALEHSGLEPHSTACR